MIAGDVFRCVNCDRQQPYAPAGVPGGVTELEAQACGWDLGEAGWRCPFCAGNEERLERVFNGEPPLRRRRRSARREP